MNPVHRRPLMTGVVILTAAVLTALMLGIGFYVQDTNRNTKIEQREVRLHRIETGKNLTVLCQNQRRIGDALGLDGQLECPVPEVFDESGLGH
jgi:uncharacterized protein HemX